MMRVISFLAGLIVVGTMTYVNVMHTGGFRSDDAPLIIGLAVLVLVGASIVGYGYGNGNWKHATGLLLCVLAGELYWAMTNTERELQAMGRASAPLAQAAEARGAAERRVAGAESAKRAADEAAISKAAEKGCARYCKEMLSTTQTAADQELGVAREALRLAPKPLTNTALADVLEVRPERLALFLAILRSLAVIGGSLAVGLALHPQRKELSKSTAPEPLKTADVAAFALKALTAAPGESVESKRLFPLYCAMAAETGQNALPRAAFDTQLATLWKEAGLEVQPVRNGIKVLGVKLAA